MQRNNSAILQSSNLFAFTMNNPVGFTDPSGMVAIPLGIMNGGLGPLQMVSPLLRVMQATINATNQARTTRQTSSSTSSGTSGSSLTVGAVVGTGSITQQMRASMAAKPCPKIVTKGLEFVWNGVKWVRKETAQQARNAGNWIQNQAARQQQWIVNQAQNLGNAARSWFFGGSSKINKAHIFARGIIDGTMGKGFETAYKVKNHLGAATSGHSWHHIVENSQIAKSNFCPTIIHNTANMIELPGALHNKVSGFYSSIPSLDIVDTGGKIFRNWLAGQSFEEQFKWGIWVVELIGGR